MIMLFGILEMFRNDPLLLFIITLGVACAIGGVPPIIEKNRRRGIKNVFPAMLEALSDSNRFKSHSRSHQFTGESMAGTDFFIRPASGTSSADWLRLPNADISVVITRRITRTVLHGGEGDDLVDEGAESAVYTVRGEMDYEDYKKILKMFFHSKSRRILYGYISCKNLLSGLSRYQLL